MRKQIVTLTILLVLVIPSVGYAEADLVDISGGLIAKQPYIQSPTNTTYTYSSLTLNITFHAPMYGNDHYSMNYSLDGKSNQTVNLGLYYFGFDQQSKNYIDSSIPLLNLSEGKHTLTVFLVDVMYFYVNNITTTKSYHDSQTVVFTIVTNSLSPFVTPSSSNPSPSVPEFSFLLVIPLLLSVLIVAVMIRIKKGMPKN